MTKTLQQIANNWREQHPTHDGGVVLIWNGEAYGWKNTLRDPQQERPGVYAVDLSGNVWVAVGGNDYDGAHKWVVSGGPANLQNLPRA